MRQCESIRIDALVRQATLHLSRLRRSLAKRAGGESFIRHQACPSPTLPRKWGRERKFLTWIVANSHGRKPCQLANLVDDCDDGRDKTCPARGCRYNRSLESA